MYFLLKDHDPVLASYVQSKKEIGNSVQNWAYFSQICCFHLQSAVKYMEVSDWLKSTLIVKLENFINW